MVMTARVHVDLKQVLRSTTSELSRKLTLKLRSQGHQSSDPQYIKHQIHQLNKILRLTFNYDYPKFKLSNSVYRRLLYAYL